MAFGSVKAFTDSYEAGQSRITTWRKTPAVTTASGYWFDMSMSPGNPPAQYYAAAPLAARAMSQSVDGGIFHGAATPSGSDKHLHRFTAFSAGATGLPMPMILADYLMYYPFVDEGSLDPQLMDNTVTLPRYSDGAGVRMMAVVVAAQLGGQSFTVNYTNSDGVAGRVTPAHTITTGQSVTGTIATSAPATQGCIGPFLALQTGDTGVRSVESVTMNGEDVGLFSLVLVKPLADISLRGIDAPVEVDFLKDRPSLPIVEDDAFLGLIAYPTGTLAAVPFHGTAEYVWS